MLRPPYHVHLPFLLLLLCLPPCLAAGGFAASTVDNVGFWLGFTLLVALSSLEAAMSVIWTRQRVTSDFIHPGEYSCRVCGREIILIYIDRELGIKAATEGVSGGCCCVSSKTSVMNGKAEATVDSYGSVLMVPYLLIRRFNPSMSLVAPAGLVNNVLVFFKHGSYTVGQLLEHGVDLIVGLTDISLGVAGLALNPRSPEALYTTLKDPKAAMTFENYSTMFLLYWLLGAVLLICTIPMRSERMSLQIFGLPGRIAFAVANMASLALFAVGCWKIDVARKAHEDWRPMLTYWIAGATAISFPLCRVEVFHIFGVVGLVFMLKHTF